MIKGYKKKLLGYLLQVLIIDEAHNLSDTLSCIHSAELSGAQVNTLFYNMHKIQISKTILPCDVLMFQFSAALSCSLPAQPVC